MNRYSCPDKLPCVLEGKEGSVALGVITNEG